MWKLLAFWKKLRLSFIILGNLYTNPSVYLHRIQPLIGFPRLPPTVTNYEFTSSKMHLNLVLSSTCQATTMSYLPLQWPPSETFGWFPFLPYCQQTDFMKYKLIVSVSCPKPSMASHCTQNKISTLYLFYNSHSCPPSYLILLPLLPNARLLSAARGTRNSSPPKAFHLPQQSPQITSSFRTQLKNAIPSPYQRQALPTPRDALLSPLSSRPFVTNNYHKLWLFFLFCFHICLLDHVLF